MSRRRLARVSKAAVQAQAAADRAARSDAVEVLGRIGLTARGALWILIGLIVGRIALGSSDDSADKQGALDTLVERRGAVRHERADRARRVDPCRILD